MINKFLFLAYSFLWLVFVLYAWNVSRRQAQLRKELDDLKNRLQGQAPSDPRAS